MTAPTLRLTPSALPPVRAARTAPGPLAVDPVLRALIGVVGVGFTAATALALARYAAGLAPLHPGLRHASVLVHVASVVPAVPLGAWLMLARKGTARHRQLGKLWVVLMVLAALSALFIRGLSGGGFGPIHLFVPLTLHGAYQAVATARRGDIAAHKKALTTLYLGALVIPGIIAFLPGRLLGTGLFG